MSLKVMRSIWRNIVWIVFYFLKGEIRRGNSSISRRSRSTSICSLYGMASSQGHRLRARL